MDNIVFIDAICPRCGMTAGNGGVMGATMKCSTCGWESEPPTQKDIDRINQLFDTAFPDPPASTDEICEAIDGLSELEKFIVPVLAKLNYEGEGNADAEHIRRHLQLAVLALDEMFNREVDK